MVACPVLLVRHAGGRDVELAADDGEDARGFRSGVKLGDAVQIPVVRYCKRASFHLRRPRHERLDLGRAVEEAVLGVAVEVAELGHVGLAGAVGGAIANSVPTLPYTSS